MNLSEKNHSLRVNSLFALFGFLLFCFCFVSCSEDEAGGAPAGEGIAVSFRLPSIGVSATRASLDDGTTVRVLVYAKGATSGAPVAQNTYLSTGGSLTSCVVDNQGKVTSGAGIEMFLTSGEYDFYAITPALAVTAQADGLFAADVAQRVDFASSVTARVVSASTGSAVQLAELERKCAKLTFAVDVAEDVSGGISTTSLVDVSLSPMPTSQGVMGNGDLLAKEGNSTLTVSDVFTTDLSEPRKASGSFIVLPRGNASLDLSLRARFNAVTSVTTLFRNAAVSVPAFEKGKSYTFTVRLGNDGKLKLWLAVSQWNTSEQDLNLGGMPTGPVHKQLIGEWTEVTWESNLGGMPTGPIITGVSGWWNNVNYNPHLGSSDANSND